MSASEGAAYDEDRNEEGAWSRGVGVEKDIGIQHFKNDPSLNDLEVAQIASWVENGMPEGNPADMPPTREFASGVTWLPVSRT